MPATIDNKGIASGYSDDEDGWGALVNQNLRQLSSYVVDGFAQDVTTTTGLTYGYKRGVGLMPGGLVQIDAGTLVLPPSTAGFVVRTLAGIVSFQTSPVFPDKIHMSTVTTNVSAIISVRDDRYMQDMTQDGNFTARVVTATTSINASTSINAATTVNATGNITAGGNAIIGGSALVTGAITGASVAVTNAAFPLDVRSGVATFGGGPSQGAEGTIAMAAIVNPSATPTNRYVGWQSGDNITVRGMQLRMSRLFIGTQSNPAFVGGEQVSIEGVTRLQSGAGALQLGAGPNDFVIMELYPRTATPTVRGGFIGYNVAAGTNLEMLNVLGPVVLSSNNGAVTIGAGGLTSNGFVNGTQFNGIQFNGSGAGLTTGTVPQAAVTNLVATLANLTSLVSNRSLLGHTHTTGEVSGLNTTIDGINTTLASKMNTGADVATTQLTGIIPAARYGVALGWATQVGGFNRLSVPIADTNSGTIVSANSGSSFATVGGINAAIEAVAAPLRQLIADLTARGII